MVFHQFTLVHIGTSIVTLQSSVASVLLCSFHLLVLSVSPFVSAFPQGVSFELYFSYYSFQ